MFDDWFSVCLWFMVMFGLVLAVCCWVLVLFCGLFLGLLWLCWIDRACMEILLVVVVFICRLFICGFWLCGCGDFDCCWVICSS